VLAIGWTATSGAGGVGYQNSDYLASNAQFMRLINEDWPITMTEPGGNSNHQYPIVYYSGYYLPAALIGKYSNWNIANFALFLWTLAGILILLFGITVFLLSRDTRLLYFVPVLLLLYVLIGGGDSIGTFLAGEALKLGTSEHLEWWNYYLQYSSNTTLLYWVPQHTVGTWVLAILLLLIKDDKGKVIHYLLESASLLITSPFGAVGLFPFILYFCLRDIKLIISTIRQFPVITNGAVSITCALISALYITANSFSFPSGIIFLLEDAPQLIDVVQFWLLEIGIWLIFILVISFFRKENIFNPVLVISLILLSVFPLYKMGYYNDFVMRASIGALTVLWIYILMLLGELLLAKKHLLTIFAMIFVVVTSQAAINEITRAIANFSLEPPKNYQVSELENALDAKLIKQRMGNSDSFFFKYLAKDFKKETVE